MSFIFFKRTIICFVFINIVFTTLSYSQKKDFKKEPFDRQKDSFPNYEKYIFYRNKKNKLRINKRNLKTIYKNTQSSEDDYFDGLKSISIVLPNKNIIGRNLTFCERAYVHAYVTEYLLKCQEKFKDNDPYKNTDLVHWVTGLRYRNAYNKEFKKYDYYGLKRLKKNHLKNFAPFEYPRPTDKKTKDVVY